MNTHMLNFVSLIERFDQIGFGNWGSVWLCMPFAETSHSRSPEPLNEVKVATKLVHRSKTATTKARVQSL